MHWSTGFAPHHRTGTSSPAAGNSVLLKGGLVLELRLERARTTKDVDLRMTGPSDRVLEDLQLAARGHA